MTPVSEDEDNVLKAFTVPKNRSLASPLQVITIPALVSKKSFTIKLKKKPIYFRRSEVMLLNNSQCLKDSSKIPCCHSYETH